MQAIAVRVRRQWETVTFSDVAWVIGCALLIVIAKGAGRWFRGVPGHSGAFWIPILFLARGGTGKTGTASIVAMLGASLWCFPQGEGGTDIASYVAAGLALDIMAGDADRLRCFPFAVLAGGIANLAKFGFHLIPALVLSVSSGFMRIGVAPVAGLHIAFGMLGGVIGWLLLNSIRKDRGTQHGAE